MLFSVSASVRQRHHGNVCGTRTRRGSARGIRDARVECPAQPSVLAAPHHVRLRHAATTVARLSTRVRIARRTRVVPLRAGSSDQERDFRRYKSLLMTLSDLCLLVCLFYFRIAIPYIYILSRSLNVGTMIPCSTHYTPELFIRICLFNFAHTHYIISLQVQVLITHCCSFTRMVLDLLPISCRGLSQPLCTWAIEENGKKDTEMATTRDIKETMEKGTGKK
jgi:hypothetical protein